jgi:hypothetical protein
MTPGRRRTDYGRHRPRGLGGAGVTIASAAVLAGLGLAVPQGAATAAPSVADGLVPVGQAAQIPASARDLGAAAPDGQLRLEFVLKPRDPATLAEFVTAVSTPGSPLYRDYLARGQFGPQFGPASVTIAAVRTALTDLGLRAGQASSGGLLLPVAGTVAQVEAALGTSVHAFRLASGEVAEANVTAPRLPAAIAADIQAIVGLDTLPIEEPALAAAPAASATIATAQRAQLAAGQPVACAKANASGGWTAPEIAQAYDIDPLYVAGDFGAGEQADLVEFASFHSQTIANYQKCYGTHVPIHTISVDGGSADSPSSEDEVDIEDLASLAPKLTRIDVYEAPNTGADEIELLSKVAADDNARVVSDSWDACETSQSAVAVAEQPFLVIMTVQGQSFFSAAGDSGSQSCKAGKLDVASPTSQPYVTSVGGTNLNGLGNAPAVPPSENAWNSGGGGISALWQMPSWQLHTVPGVINHYSSNKPCKAPSGQYCREVPDVSANAGVGYATLTGGSGGFWGHIGGTSLAAPTWAAITLLADASSASCRKKAVGFINPALYKLAVSTPADFNDITSGNNDNGDPAVHGAYPATKGYDLATGLGTPEAANLAQSLCGGSYWTPQTTIPIPVTTPNGDSPAITSYNHTLYVAWTDTKHHIDYETFNGTTWSIPFIVEFAGGAAATTTHSPGIAVSDGTLWAGWTTSTGKVEASSLQHTGWTKPVVIGAGKAESSTGPALTAGGGEVFAAWKGHSTDNVYLSIETGNAWGSQTRVTGASTPSRPAIAYYSSLGAIVTAWRTSSNTMQYEVLSIFGFGGVATIPGGTNNSPALTVLGKRLYVAWKGTTTDKIFLSYQPDGKLYSTWSGEESEPQALTLGFPQIAGIRATLFTVWTGKSGTRLWYNETDPPL